MRNFWSRIFSYFIVVNIFFSCNDIPTNQTDGQLSQGDNEDIEEVIEEIKGIKIGNQTWSVYNLNVDNFRNGKEIKEAKSADEWERFNGSETPAWCYYEDDMKNGNKYGKLYNYWAVHNRQNLAPEGWHIPTFEEWEILINYCGGFTEAGLKMKTSMGWHEGLNNVLGNGNNTSGFNALPAGICFSNRQFKEMGYETKWWTSSEDGKYPIYIILTNNNNEVKVSKTYFGAVGGLSIRCVKD
jgi:uncharacterized protein (TIGR02145 family)